jgi:hypothetical protein
LPSPGFPWEEEAWPGDVSARSWRSNKRDAAQAFGELSELWPEADAAELNQHATLNPFAADANLPPINFLDDDFKFDFEKA